jgi:RNA polymerase sigma-70 factor (ECF subfamily)
MAPEPDDVTLMLRYRAGDLAAFDALYGRHKGPLYRYCVRQCRNPDFAADLFQDVWSRIVRARHDYRPTAKFTTYLYSIAHNCLVDHVRRQQRLPAGVAPCGADGCDPADHAPGPEEAVASAEAGRHFRAALGALPAEQREAFLLHEEAGLTLAEIAAVTGVPAETVKSRLRYALRKLRSALVPGGGPR